MQNLKHSFNDKHFNETFYETLTLSDLEEELRGQTWHIVNP